MKKAGHKEEMAARKQRRAERKDVTSPVTPVRPKPRPTITDVAARKKAAEHTSRRQQRNLRNAAATAKGRLWEQQQQQR